MKNNCSFSTGVTELTKEECAGVTGGGEISNYVRCVGITLTSGGGGIKTLVLGVGLFGLARILGVAVGCANL
jgi:hypothetical protein